MIGYLKGRLVHVDEQAVMVEVGGVGYEVFVGAVADKIAEPGAQVTLWVHTYVREDQLSLFGFREQIQKKIFLILTGISGIGPKLAMSVIGQLSVGELVDAITMDNTKVLRGIPGVGPKMASRMVLELKDKLAAFIKKHQWAEISSDGSGIVWQELSQALGGLGFSDSDIRNVVKLLRKSYDGGAPEINELLKTALQKIKNC